MTRQRQRQQPVIQVVFFSKVIQKLLLVKEVIPLETRLLEYTIEKEQLVIIYLQRVMTTVRPISRKIQFKTMVIG